MDRVLERLLEERRAGRPCVLATVVRAWGSTPRDAGARMLVRTEGGTVGSIGGGAFEATVTADAREMLQGCSPRTALKRYTFTEKGDDALGMACGGSAEVFLERFDAGPRLVIFGAGHVGLALAELAASVGFRVQLVDDRPEAVEAARGIGGVEVFPCGPDYAEGAPPLDASCYVAVVTRCHRTDRLALRTVLRSPRAYVGLIGSRRKRAVILKRLVDEDGIPAEWVDAVRCPIGVPVGGNHPREIAVSIVAELLQARYGILPARESAPGTSLSRP